MTRASRCQTGAVKYQAMVQRSRHEEVGGVAFCNKTALPLSRVCERAWQFSIRKKKNLNIV